MPAESGLTSSSNLQELDDEAARLATWRGVAAVQRHMAVIILFGNLPYIGVISETLSGLPQQLVT